MVPNIGRGNGLIPYLREQVTLDMAILDIEEVLTSHIQMKADLMCVSRRRH